MIQKLSFALILLLSPLTFADCRSDFKSKNQLLNEADLDTMVSVYGCPAGYEAELNGQIPPAASTPQGLNAGATINYLGSSIQCSSEESIGFFGKEPACIQARTTNGGMMIRTPSADGGMTVNQGDVRRLQGDDSPIPLYDVATGKIVDEKSFIESNRPDSAPEKKDDQYGVSNNDWKEAVNDCSSVIESNSPKALSCVREACKVKGNGCYEAAEADICAKNSELPGCPSTESVVNTDNDMSVTEEKSKYSFNADSNNPEDVDIEQCIQLKKSAGKWCSEQNSMYNMLAQQMMAAFKQPDGIAEGCKLQQQLSNMGSSAELAMAGTCSYRSNQCRSVCEQAINRLEAMITNLNNEHEVASKEGSGATVSQYRQIVEVKAKVQSKLNLVKGGRDECVNNKDQVFSKTMNASMMQLQAYGAKKCVSEVKKAETGFDAITNNDVFAGDCTSAANASNPICIKCNADPSAAGCEGITTRNGNDTASADPFGDDADSFGGENGYTDAAYDMSNGDVELDTPGGVQAASKGSRTIASGGGGGPGNSGSGSGGGGLSAPQKPGDPNKKLNTDLVGGEKGGSGYSVSTGGGGGGGFSDIGASSNRTIFEDLNDKGFNLKDFLPGRGKKGKKDSLSGLQKLRQPAMVGKSTQNIFEMIHNRYKILCLQGRLMGCKQKIPWKKPEWAID